MSAENELGDLIVELKLDDSKYRSDVKAALNDTNNQARAAGRNASAQLGSFKQQTVEASHAVRALSSSLYLVTGETGFFAVELGRTGVHLARFISSSGGMLAAMRLAAGGIASLIAGLGPLGVILAAVGVAYAIFNRATASTSDSMKTATQSAKDLQQALQNVQLKIGEQAGVFTSREVRAELLRQQHPGLRNEQYFEMVDKQIELERIQQEAKDSAKRFQKRRDDISNTTSKLMGALTSRSELLSETSAPGFTFGSQAASGFRFGAGAMGSVIGQNTEQQKTHDKLDTINRTLKEEFAKLIGNPVDSFGPGSAFWPTVGF